MNRDRSAGREPASTPQPRRSVRIIGYLAIAAIGYLCMGVLAFACALSLLRSGIATEFPWINAVQRNLYQGGLRAIWQTDPSCTTYDEELIYRPKDGTCRFRNAEFDTILTHRNGTRIHPPASSPGTGIAILGDSHAMGWGVGDGETFAALLQSVLGRPVHNLAVSSYGTARQLLALERSGILDSVDTVLVQYCENDRDENVSFRVPTKEDSKRVFATIMHREPPAGGWPAPYLLAGLRYSLKVPFAAAKEAWRGERSLDFVPHYEPLVRRLAAYPALAGKRVVVFYINGYGQRFRQFPDGPDPRLPYVRFADLRLERSHFYSLDDHMTASGHRYAAERLAEILRRPR